MDNIVLQILAAIIIAAVSAWITVQLSLRRYRTEKWWERKADAYSRVIEALHDAKAHVQERFEADIEGRGVKEDRVKLLEDRARAAEDEISKTRDVGAFLLCDEALNRLTVYQKEARTASNTMNWAELLDNVAEATDRCITDIIEIAKSDLRIRC